MNQKTAAALFIVVLLVSMFMSIANIDTADAYANQDFNTNRASWPMFHGNLAHTGHASTIAPRTNNTLWKFSCDQGFETTAAIANGVVYIGSTYGYLHALNFSTGEELWKTHFDGGATTPAIEDGVLYAGGTGEVHAVDAATGEVLWTFRSINFDAYNPPAVKDGFVYFGCLIERCVYALNASNGDIIWNYTMGGSPSTPAVAGGVVYVSSYDGWVYALSAATGELVWKYKAAEYVDSPPTISDGRVYVGSGRSVFYALDASTGRRIWYFFAGDDIFSSSCVANGKVFFGSNDGNCYALNAATGAKLWNYTVKGPRWLDCAPAYAGGILYITPRNGVVYALNAETGAEVWSYDTGYNPSTGFPPLTSPSIANAVLVVGSDNGTVYAFGSVQGPAPTHDSP